MSSKEASSSSSSNFVPIVKTGHPDFQKDLSEADQKKVDEKGRAVVLGLPWSEAGTDLWLTVFVSNLWLTGQPSKMDRKAWGKHLGLPDQARSLGLFVTSGKPRFANPGWGASLELPSDLARDELKVRYVTEWVIETVKESLSESGGNLEHLKALSGEIVLTVEDAVRRAGL